MLRSGLTGHKKLQQQLQVNKFLLIKKDKSFSQKEGFFYV